MISSLFLATLLSLKFATPGNLIHEIQDSEYIESDQTYDSGITELFKDIGLKLGVIENDPEEIYVINEVKNTTSLLASSDEVKYKNVVVYNGSFGGSSVKLVLPASAINSLDIINGYLVNVGTSSLTGRFLYDGDILDPNEYDTYSYILNPIYGNTSNVYTYGSFNYERHYYLNTSSGYNRITYTDTYGRFSVDDYKLYYSSSDRLYYAFLAFIVFMGVIFIWIRRLSRH